MLDINNIEVQRGIGEYNKYCRDKSVVKNNNFFIAIDNNEDTIATGELYIISQSVAKLNIYIEVEGVDKEKVTNLFIDEILYWNAFLKTIYYENGEFENKGFKELKKIHIDDIQPSQLYISKEKLKNVSSWLDSEEKLIIPVLESNGTYISLDGHTRIVQGYINGYENVYIYIDNDSNLEDYRVFIDWCKNANIKSVKDLTKRIISKDEYEIKWNNRCRNYFENIEND